MQISDKDQSTLGLLFNEAPLLIRKQLAVRIGLNEAIVLQQIHFHIQNKYQAVKERDRADDRAWHEGTFWVYNTFEEWHENEFPFLSVRTLKRVFKKMEDDGILRSGKFNRMKTDQTKWYTINYEKLQMEVTPQNVAVDHSDNMAQCVVDHSDNLAQCTVDHSDNMASSIVPTWHERECQSGTMLPKTTKEVPLDSSSSSRTRQIIDIDLKSKFPDKPFELIRENLLRDESAIIETDKQYESMLSYRLKYYKPKHQSSSKSNGSRGKFKSTYVEIIPEHMTKEYVNTDSPEETARKEAEIKRILTELRS